MFKTLDDLKQKGDDKKKDKKNTNFYTGGEKSGLAVESPDSFWEKTKEQADKQKDAPKGKIDVTITLWQNGFQLNQGELRDYLEEKNKIFMEQLQQGQVPQELQKEYIKGCYVDVENKKDQPYRPPTPPKYTSFQGQGISLYGIFASDIPAQQQQVQNCKMMEAPKQSEVQKGENMTTILVRSAAGQRIEINLPITAKVQELYLQVQKLSQSSKFVLMAGYPPKQLTNMQETLETAELLEAQVIQKII